MTQPLPTSPGPTPARLAAQVLSAFLGTFLAARIVVFLIMSRRMPDLYLDLGGTHVHHLNYGIFLLSVVGGYLRFVRPVGLPLRVAAVTYGVGLGSVSRINVRLVKEVRGCTATVTSRATGVGC